MALGYTFVTDHYTVNAGDVTSGAVVIPDTYDDGSHGVLPVTEIESVAFAGLNITSLTIGNNVTIVRSSAFNGCGLLTSITIGTGLLTLETYAFYGVSAVSITFPAGFQSIGSGAFQACESLETIILPDSITNISNYAFYHNFALTSFTIGNTTPPTLGTTGIFDADTGLTIYVPSASVDAYKAATGWSTYADIIEASSPPPALAYTLIDGNTHYSVNAGTVTSGDVVIPDTYLTKPVTKIEDTGFLNLTGITSVTIGANVTYIGISAFNGCSGLTSLTIPDNVTTIGINAFGSCTGLTSAILSSALTKVNDGMFSGCTLLADVTIPDNVTTIGNSSFAGCTGLESIIIPDNVTLIDIGAFAGCTGLTDVTLSATLETIKSGAFAGCSSLAGITLPDGLITIENTIFENCVGLTGITIPGSVETMDDACFYGCSVLAVVMMEGATPPTLGGYAFDACPTLTEIHVPTYEAIAIYKATTNWSAYASIIVGPAPPPPPTPMPIYKKSMFPIPSIKYIPKIFLDDPDLAHLTDKLDTNLIEWETDVLDLMRLIRPDECASWTLDELGFFLSANILPKDDDHTKRVKVCDAVKNQKIRGCWTLSVKGIIDAITGLDSAMTHIYDTDEWELMCGDEDVTTAGSYRATLGVTGDDDKLGLWPFVGDEIFMAGNILIDCHHGIHTSTLTAGQIADLILALATNVLPAYMRMFLGYFDSSDNFVIYSEVT